MLVICQERAALRWNRAVQLRVSSSSPTNKGNDFSRFAICRKGRVIQMKWLAMFVYNSRRAPGAGKATFAQPRLVDTCSDSRSVSLMTSPASFPYVFEGISIKDASWSLSAEFDSEAKNWFLYELHTLYRRISTQIVLPDYQRECRPMLDAVLRNTLGAVCRRCVLVAYIS